MLVVFYGIVPRKVCEDAHAGFMGLDNWAAPFKAIDVWLPTQNHRIHQHSQQRLW